MTVYDPAAAQSFIATYPEVPPALALRVYTSRLLGEDPGLVLHGGGNTSVKIALKDVVGEERDVLFMKGSGVDLAGIGPSGFTGLELAPLKKLRRLLDLSDEEMENELETHKICFSSPSPSVEALLHAFLPHRFIDHTHADLILVLAHQKNPWEVLREALGTHIAVVPYFHPGIRLAQAVAEAFEKEPGLEGIVVLDHGIFTFGEDARTSYESMTRHVENAEKYIREKTRGKKYGRIRDDLSAAGDPVSLTARCNPVIRGACAHRTADGRLRRFYVENRTGTDIVEASSFFEAKEFCDSGALTPDHVIRTKGKWAYLPSVPEADQPIKEAVGNAIADYRAAYDEYFRSQLEATGMEAEKSDPYPRIFLMAGAGLVALGETRKDARIAADIAEHTLRAKVLAGSLGHFEPISESRVFEMEYWKLQRKKLGRPPAAPLHGQSAVVTGGAGAVGLGIADRLLTAGAAVVIADIDEKGLGKVYSLLERKYGGDRLERMIFNVTDYGAVERAFTEITGKWGGIDLLVPNAGVALASRMEDLDPKQFEKVAAVNLMGTFHVIKASIPIFRRQATGGNIVVISSKNVFDPGAAFGAYSASKAAAHQISKIAALELAELGVRVNLVNPDAVFGDEEVPSKLWETVGPERMKSRGLDPKGLREYYRQRNLLKVSVTAEHVGNAVVFFASEATPTTGATLPVDGGIPAAFPR